MKKYISSFVAIFIATLGFAQNQNPVSWTTKVEGNKVILTAMIEKPWHMYDMDIYEGGPCSTVISFELPDGVKLIGGVKAITKPVKSFDEMFQMEIGYYAQKAVFEQTFENKTGKIVTLKGSVEWQVCDDESCLAPAEHEFEFQIGTSKKK